MGRVDDALRRLRERPAEPAGSPPAAAVDAFPTEAADVGLLRSTKTETAAPDAAGAAEMQPETPEAGDAADDVAGGSPMHLSRQLDAKIVVDARMSPGSREEYRRLAAALHHANEATGVKLVMIASAVAGEGKSLTAANLALTLSESYRRRVLLIDGDLRRPVQHRFFGLDAPSGLCDVLSTVEEPDLTLYEVSPTLTILPAGQPSSDPMAGLTSVRMRRLLEEARASFDWVLIDTPPIGLLSDANLLAAMVDAAILVIKANTTSYEQVRRAAEAVGRERILGAVLNRATVDERASYDYYRYYHRADAKVASG
jgi:capsular exopolysaccharide synthesis family protein